MRVMRALALGAIGYGAYRLYKYNQQARREHEAGELEVPPPMLPSNAPTSMDLIG